MQELDSQRGEGAYFRRGAYFQGNTVNIRSSNSPMTMLLLSISVAF